MHVQKLPTHVHTPVNKHMCNTHSHTLMHTHTDLFGAAFKDQVLLTLVQPPFLQGPEVQNSVFSLQQLVQNSCTRTTGRRTEFAPNTFHQEVLLTRTALTFDLLLRSPGVSGGSRGADVVSVDVLEEHLCVPAGQRARLKHQHSS